MRLHLGINLVIAGSTLLAACAPPPPPGFKQPTSAYITTSGFSTPEQEILTQVISDLELAVGEGFLSNRASDYEIPIKFDGLDPEILGQAWVGDIEDCPIQISPELRPGNRYHYTDTDLRIVLIHEIGHCFGLEHSLDPKDIMYYAHSDEHNTPEAYERFIKQLQDMRKQNSAQE